ncbi:MAG: alpha/beta hydrolase-fold protein, partial [Mycobacteriales bacterium]
GTPSDVIDFLQATHLYEAELRARRVGPMILVIPDSGGARGQPSQECVNSASGVLDDTYLTTDLRSWVLARYRAATDGASWGLLGYSEGGFCAANLALRHPSLFGAAISLDGYFQPEVDDTTGNIYGGSAALRAANDPMQAIAHYHPGQPLPSFFLVSPSRGFYHAQAAAFHALVSRLEAVPFVVQDGPHVYPKWRAATPMVLDWAWHTLAPPDLARLFPTLPAITRPGEFSVVVTPPGDSTGPAPVFAAIVTRPRPSPAPSASPHRSLRPRPTGSPSPTARPSQSPSPSPRPSPSPSPGVRPSPSPRPSPTPTRVP